MSSVGRLYYGIHYYRHYSISIVICKYQSVSRMVLIQLKTMPDSSTLRKKIMFNHINLTICSPEVTYIDCYAMKRSNIKTEFNTMAQTGNNCGHFMYIN